MKRKTNYKNLIALALVLIVMISITVTPAYAEFPPLTTAGRRLGSWILSGITALNIALSSTVSTSRGADIINFLGDPLDLTYSYTELWEDKPTIQIWDDYVTIDGTTYTDIWLSNEAAQKFKTDGLDFATAYSIASNTNGTFVSGVGSIDGTPLFNNNGQVISQSFSQPDFGSAQIGNTTVNITRESSIWSRFSSTLSNGTTATKPSLTTSLYGPPTNWQWRKDGYYYNLYFKKSSQNSTSQLPSNSPLIVNNPFDFDWVSGTIDTTPLPADTGMMIRVPSDTPGLQTFIQNNIYLTEPTEIDVDLDPDIQGTLDDLIDIIAPILINLDSHDITYTTNHEAPAPVPDVPIVDATVDQVTQPIINEITNYGDQITQQIPQIIETIPTIDDICNNIDTAPYHDLDTGLDKLPTVFLPFITDLRSALGIWHYVTEWLGMIGTSFAFVTGALAGTAIMTPIYAAIAGYMCIKVYRRMTG